MIDSPPGPGNIISSSGDERDGTMKKRICDFIIKLLEKHGELVLVWNGVKYTQGNRLRKIPEVLGREVRHFDR